MSPKKAPTYTARVLVGPGALVLGPGEYHAWVRITDVPEIPHRQFARIVVV